MLWRVSLSVAAIGCSCLTWMQMLAASSSQGRAARRSKSHSWRKVLCSVYEEAK